MCNAEVDAMDVQAEANNPEIDATEGLEDISLSDGSENGLSDDNEGSEGNRSGTKVDETGVERNVGGGFNFKEEYAVNGVDDLHKFDLKNLSVENLMRIHFPDLAVAFMFYNWYGNVNGFSARKSKLLWNSNGEMYQQTFVCHKEGKRETRNFVGGRKREPNPTTRCGCKASCKVHVEGSSGRWYIKYFNDVHNHEFLEDKYSGMLPAHRNLNEFEKSQMQTMKKVGIRTPHIYGYLASQAGGYNMLQFLRRDLYNEQVLQRHIEDSDAKAALDFLEDMHSRDEFLFWRHTKDSDGRLEHLFWCDGVGRRDFSVFGDVLAFDATYRKNKYLCPLVVFSGVKSS